jgi:hypothetical protein
MYLVSPLRVVSSCLVALSHLHVTHRFDEIFPISKWAVRKFYLKLCCNLTHWGLIKILTDRFMLTNVYSSFVRHKLSHLGRRR